MRSLSPLILLVIFMLLVRCTNSWVQPASVDTERCFCVFVWYRPNQCGTRKVSCLSVYDVQPTMWMKGVSSVLVWHITNQCGIKKLSCLSLHDVITTSLDKEMCFVCRMMHNWPVSSEDYRNVSSLSLHDVWLTSVDKEMWFVCRMMHNWPVSTEDYRNVSSLSLHDVWLTSVDKERCLVCLHDLYSISGDTENIFDCPRMTWYTKFHEYKLCGCH